MKKKKVSNEQSYWHIWKDIGKQTNRRTKVITKKEGEVENKKKSAIKHNNRCQKTTLRWNFREKKIVSSMSEKKLLARNSTIVCVWERERKPFVENTDCLCERKRQRSGNTTIIQFEQVIRFLIRNQFLEVDGSRLRSRLVVHDIL